MPKNEQRAAESHLEVLMMHIVKVIIQPWKMTFSWLNSIRNSRIEIQKLQKKAPSLNRNFFEKIWDKVFRKAKKKAEEETGETCDLENLDWKDVFDKDWDKENPDEGENKK